VALRPSRQAAILALACAGVVARDAAAEQTCYTIQPGDTAAYIALRFTGSVQHRNEPWFQIVDPTVPRRIPKAEYGRIRPGWRTCVPETRFTVEWRRATGIHAASRGTAATIESVAGAPFILLGSGVALLVLALIAWRATSTHLKRRQAATRVMQSFAERFISEFERPLRQPGSAARPLEARMRLVQRRRRVDILLAPTGGRSYPNLTDHGRNMTYDVGRVVRLIADTRFTTGDVYAHGRWVVVPCRLTTEPTQEGGR
jgi:hypothetical protein